MDLSPHLELSCNVNCHGVIVLIHMCIALYLFFKIFFQVITFTVCRSAILLPKFCDMFSYAEINISRASNVWLYRWLVCARAFFIFCVGWAVFFTRPFVCVCVCLRAASDAGAGQSACCAEHNDLAKHARRAL